MDMNGKVVLVTGGGSGMGQLACRLMSERGARVAALDVNVPKLVPGFVTVNCSHGCRSVLKPALAW